MASWKEIEGFRKDPKAARLLAKSLRKTGSGVLNEWEADFLVSLSRWQHELTTRQAEKLLQIRDGLVTITVFHGFSVEKLLAGCHLAPRPQRGRRGVDRQRARQERRIGPALPNRPADALRSPATPGRVGAGRLSKVFAASDGANEAGAGRAVY
jgi:hypothetical protein